MTNVKFDFSARSVIVTGAARGIGLEISRAFASWGANVYLADLDADAIQSAAEEVGGVPVAMDVTASDQVNATVGRVMDETSRLDIIVNNAGILRDRILWKLEDPDWDAVLATHLGGAFRLSRAAVPHMRATGFGRIINVTSYSGLHGNAGQSNYSAAKAGIIGFTRTVAKEVARFGITVNAISPNASTRMVGSMPAEKQREIQNGIPMGRFAAASEMAPAVGFLASQEAAYITGIVLPVDGGLSI